MPIPHICWNKILQVHFTQNKGSETGTIKGHIQINQPLAGLCLLSAHHSRLSANKINEEPHCQLNYLFNKRDQTL